MKTQTFHSVIWAVIMLFALFTGTAQAAQWQQVCKPDYSGGQTCEMRCSGIGCPLGGPQIKHKVRPNYGGGYTVEEKCSGVGCPLGGPQWRTVCKPNYSGGTTCKRQCSGIGCPLY